jgi:hypothetical protein
MLDSHLNFQLIFQFNITVCVAHGQHGRPEAPWGIWRVAQSMGHETAISTQT